MSVPITLAYPMLWTVSQRSREERATLSTQDDSLSLIRYLEPWPSIPGAFRSPSPNRDEQPKGTGSDKLVVLVMTSSSAP